jgi:hypothetical protein
MECNYHVILETLNATIWERIGTHYNWDFFDYWLGDESNLGRLYRETIEEITGEPLTEEQNTLLNKKGENLEKMIGKWCGRWERNNPGLQDQRMPPTCLQIKIHEYIIYQFNKRDIKEIVGNPC